MPLAKPGFGVVMPISDRQIEDMLARLRLSEAFDGQGQLSALLAYLVAQERAGLGDRLKAYSVALDMFGEQPGFDPSKDSRVRVAMYRLRAALALYFATHANTAPILIEIPKGSYRPVIRANPNAANPYSDASHPPEAEREAQPLRWFQKAFVLLLFALVLAGLYHFVLRPRPIFPSVMIEAPAKAGRSPLVDEAQALLRNGLSTQNGPVRLVEKAADYRIFLIDGSMAGCAGYALCAKIVRRDGSELEVRRYNGFRAADASAGHIAAAQMLQDIGTPNANLISDFLRSGSLLRTVNVPVLRCVIEARALILGSADIVKRDIDPIVKCLKRRVPAHRAEAFYLSELTAALYIEAGRGYLKTAVDQPFEQARREIKALRNHGDTSKFLLTTEIAYEAERPDREVKRVGLLIEKLLRDYPDDFEARIVAATTMAFTLGLTHEASEVMRADQAYDNAYFSSANYVFLIDAMVRGAADEAREHYFRIGSPSAPITAVLGFAVGCRNEREAVIADSKGALRKLGITSSAAYRQFLDARRYDAVVPAAILRFAEHRNCIARLDAR